MKLSFLISNSFSKILEVFLCIFIAAFFLYLYIDKQNQLTQLRLRIPPLTKEVKDIEEENKRLQYEIDQFESPLHLLELIRKPEFSHLKYPYEKNVIVLPQKKLNAEIKNDHK